MPAANHQKPVIDVNAALTRMAGDRQLLREMAEFFLFDVPPLLEELEEANNRGDVVSARKKAHQIKGIASNFDAFAVQKRATGIQEIGDEVTQDELRERIDSLRAEVEHVFEALRQQVLSA